MALQLKLDPTQLEAGAAKAKAALAGVKGEAVKAESAIDALAKNAAADLSTVAPAAVRAENAVAGVGRASGFAAGGGVRMLGQQLSQVAQQGAVTGNYLGALAVQLPDMALGFGNLAIAASIVATVAMPLLIEKFGAGKTAAEEMADAQDRLDDSLGTLRDISTELANLDQLKQKYGEVDAQLLQLIQHQRDQAMDAAMTAARDAITALADEYGVASGALNLFKITGTGAAADIADQLGLSKDAMIGFQIAIRDAQNATTFDEQADALARVDGYLQRSTISNVELAVGVTKTALGLRAVDKATSDSAAALGDAAGNAAKAASQVEGLAGWAQMANANISASADAADALARTNMTDSIANAGGAALTLAQRLWNAYSAAASIASMKMQSVSLGGAGRPEGIDIDPDARGAVALARAQIAAKAAADAAAGGGGGGGGGGGAAAADRTRESYDRLMASLDPVVARTQDMAEATATVDQALAAHDITATEHARAMDLIRDKYTETASAMQDLQDVGGNALDSLIGGTATLSEALRQMAKDLVFATIKAQLLNSVTGATASDSLGGILMKGLLGGFGGAAVPMLDGGGRIGIGGTAMVGERGPELVRATSGGAVVTSRVDTARQIGGGATHVTVDVGVSVDDSGKLQAYVKRVGTAAASQAVQTVRRTFGQMQSDFERDGALV